LKEAGACILVFCKPTKYYLEDGSAATQNILIAATAYGLGSCWIAGDKKEYAEAIKEFLKVPGEYKLVSLVAMGYPKGEPPQKRKRPLEEVLHWERFGCKC
jgi:nitroreductase